MKDTNKETIESCKKSSGCDINKLLEFLKKVK